MQRLFTPDGPENLRRTVETLVTPSEFDAGSRTAALNAHWTPPGVAANIWAAVTAFAATTGREVRSVLEPSCGIGEFLAPAPRTVKKMTGIEIDPVTADMARLLLPTAHVHTGSFATVDLPEEHFDLSVGNLPFSQDVLADQEYNTHCLPVPEHFLLKATRLVRPGGLLALIVPHRLLDAPDARARERIAELAQLAAAIRFPSHRSGAPDGPGVVADLLILRRRSPSSTPAPQEPAWMTVAAVPGSAVQVNEYFTADRNADPLDDVTTRLELYAGDSEQRGIYEWSSAGPHRVSNGPLVRRKDVIAINQRVYNQASFGLILTADGTKDSYLSLGRALQRAQLNDLGLGLMSSGYSSFSGRNLPTARRVKAFTATPEQSSYFALGGPVTAEQIVHTGMNEDLLHAQGPAEIIGTDLAERLPHYMVPETIQILDELPRTPNGKIDARALRETEDLQTSSDQAVGFTAPGSLLEHQLDQIWRDVLGREEPLSITAPFFSLGGNSISAVRLVRAIRSRLGVNLPIQSVFEQDTIAKQAESVQGGSSGELSRIVPLAGSGNTPVYLWPGLGGYPMNLRHLAERISTDESRCYGIQAFGLNEDESIDESIQSMAARDVDQIRRLKPGGPYTLIGYSFGARVAFEAAYQLERDGDHVDRVVLIAPGSPNVADAAIDPAGHGLYADERFVRVLYSVFFTRTDGPHADRVVHDTSDRTSFLAAIREDLPIDETLAERITALVERTYSFEYTFTELEQRTLSAPVTIIRAAGDDYSFLDSAASSVRYDSVELTADHYAVLQPPHVDTTAVTVHAALTGTTRTRDRKDLPQLPHIAVRSFPPGYPEPKRKEFLNKLASLVSTTFGISDAVVSISLETSSNRMDDATSDHETASRDRLALAGSTSGGDQ